MGEGFDMGFKLGSALSQGVIEWKQIQKDRQERKEFEGAMGLASQRRAMLKSAGAVEEAAMLEQLRGQIQRSPTSEQTERPTGNVREDGTPETEQVIRTPEGDIPVQQLLMLKARKQQAETTAELAEVDLIMELQARYPENRYVRQWVASTYAGIQQKQQIRSKQVEAQRLQLDTMGAQLEREKFDEQARIARERLGFEKRQYEEAPARQAEQERVQTDQGIRQDQARISAQKSADIEVEGVKAQNKPERAPTEFDKKIRQMAPRAEQALEQIEALEQGGGSEVYDRTGLGAGIESVTPNALRSGKRQQYEQAQLQFINSILRAESGATITDSEIQKARDQYFPKVGEAPEVVEQKRQARQTAVRELYNAGGLEAPAPKAARAAGGLSSEEQALIDAVKAGKISPAEARKRRESLRGR